MAKNTSTKVSKNLQSIGRGLDKKLTRAAGERVSFSLFIWTEGRANYISNTSDRKEIAQVLEQMIAQWRAGMPDIPAHEIS